MAEELTYDSYTVGWISVLLSELCAARALLDEEHELLPPKDFDDNNYFLGKMANHNVVIVFPGSNSINAIAQTARTFPNIRFALMVGVGSGVPKLPNSDPRKDIRLGDVVVGSPVNGHGGVITHDTVREAGELNLKMQTRFSKPPQILHKAIKRLQLDHGFGKGKMWTDIDQVVNLDVPALEDAGYPGVEHDQLFKSDYQHSAGEDCSSCDVTQIIKRGVRKTTQSVVHLGLIASGRPGRLPHMRKDPLPGSREGLSCIDIEAAGLMDALPNVLIKGICDYADSHIYRIWLPYAAIAAAAYAKDLLRVIHPKEVEITPLPKVAEPPKATQANGGTQAMGNGAGAGSTLEAEGPRANNKRLRTEVDRTQVNDNTQADVKMLCAESV